MTSNTLTRDEKWAVVEKLIEANKAMEKRERDFAAMMTDKINTLTERMDALTKRNKIACSQGAQSYIEGGVTYDDSNRPTVEEIEERYKPVGADK